MFKTMPRPISQLTSEMGFVLVIGKSGVTSTPTRASVGYRNDIDQIVDHNGDLFTENGEGAISFIEIPYDEELAIQKPVPETPFEVQDLYISARGIVVDLTPSVGPATAVRTLAMVLRDRSPFEEGEDFMSQALLEVSNLIRHDLSLTPADESLVEHLAEIFATFDEAVIDKTRDTLSSLAIHPPASSAGRVDLAYRVAKARKIIGGDFALALLKGFAKRTVMPKTRTGSNAERRLEAIYAELASASPFNAEHVLQEIEEIGAEGDAERQRSRVA